MGYDVLALTDHDHVTWPWPAFDRSPAALDMIAVPGNELSHHQHTLSLFTTYPFAVRDHHLENQKQAIHEVHELGGLTVIAHPGRYWDLQDGEVPPHVVDKYVALFKRFPSLIGHEVVNQTDRYPEDRALWDALLTQLMPDRPVWGMANDDSHTRPHVGLNSTILLLPESNRKAVRRAMESGRYFFNTRAMHPESERDRDTTPKIHRVSIEDDGSRITVDVTSGGDPIDSERCKWISADGKVVHRGTAIDLSAVDGLNRYVRLQVKGQGGITFTQPFGIKKQP
jgi:hypothetical protein